VAELSGFEVLALLKEIGVALRGTYVNNIYSVGASQLFRFRRQGAEDVWLVASPRKGVWVSRSVSERTETSEFTSGLRAELERARFAEARQEDLDRVFVLDFEGDEKRSLIVELMPPGNIIVTDSEHKILLLQEEVRAETRRLVRGGNYEPPKQSRLSPAEVSSEDVKMMLRDEKTVGRAIGKHIALPKKYVAETLSRLGLAEASPSTDIEGREDEVVEVLRQMVREAVDNPKPCLCETSKGQEIFVIPPKGAEAAESSKGISELCDRLYLGEISQARPESPGEGRRKELEITISKLKSESASMLSEAAKTRAAAAAAGTGQKDEALRILRESGARLAREPASSAAVSSALFDHAKRLEGKSAEALAAAERLEKKLSKIEPRVAGPTMSLPKRRQEWFEKFRWFVTSEGRLAVGGRDAQSNTILLRRHLDDDDVVYHADLFGSPFFVLKGGARQSEPEATELAQATVSYSSGWKTGLGAADAYWVLKDQVSRTTESGEYLSKGSFVIRGKKNFVRHAMLQLAVGLDESGRVLAGPESAIAKVSPKYVLLVPHREKTSDTAKNILKELTPAGGRTQATSLDDVIRALPAGGGKIVRRKGGTDIRDKT